MQLVVKIMKLTITIVEEIDVIYDHAYISIFQNL